MPGMTIQFLHKPILARPLAAAYSKNLDECEREFFSIMHSPFHAILQVNVISRTMEMNIH